MTKRQKIFEMIDGERRRQEDLHGDNSIVKADPHGFRPYAVLGEEYGEVGTAVLNINYYSRTGEARKAMEKDLKEELVQVAAVATAWLEAILEDDEEEADGEDG